jgi:hypothetical protein
MNFFEKPKSAAPAEVAGSNAMNQGVEKFMYYCMKALPGRNVAHLMNVIEHLFLNEKLIS